MSSCGSTLFSLFFLNCALKEKKERKKESCRVSLTIPRQYSTIIRQIKIAGDYIE